MQVLWRGNVNAWECDELGHLNVRFYMAKASEAIASLAEQLGMRGAYTPHATATLTVRHAMIRFLSEARPGAPLTIKGGVISHDETSLNLALILVHAASQDVAAAFQISLEHTEPSSGKNFPWATRIRQALRSFHTEPLAVLKTRSLSSEPPNTNISISQADIMELQETGRGRIEAGDIDAFGRMRPEFGLGKVSDSVIHFSDGFPEQWDSFANNTALVSASAVLECRLDFRRIPSLGDGFVVRSGLRSAQEKVRTVVHWVLDPVTGAPLWSMEAVACMLNLQTRKLEPASPDVLRAMQAKLKPDLKP